jgi:mannose-1-phosphate guanylyltransferase
MSPLLSPNIFVVIMAGGRGTRFWPRSRHQEPKQFINIVGSESLLRTTVNRLSGLVDKDHILIITTEDLVSQTQKNLPELPVENILVEPEGRNTGPCLAFALTMLEPRAAGGTMVVLSADHWIGDTALFQQDIQTAVTHAETKQHMVVFGIHPTHPETGYGYIEAESPTGLSRVKSFKEKPQLDQAIDYLKDPHQLWNAGMFVWTFKTLRSAFLEYSPQGLGLLDEWKRAGSDMTQLKTIYTKIEAEPIDIQIVEKSKNVSVLVAQFPWSEVGSWQSAISFLSNV